MVGPASIALLSNITVDLLARSLNKAFGDRARFDSPGFNQYRRELLGVDPWLANAKPMAVMLLLDPEEWLHQAAGLENEALEHFGATVGEDIIALVQAAHARLPATTFFVGSFFLPSGFNLPGLEFNSAVSLHDFVHAVNRKLVAFSREAAGVFLVDMGSFVSEHGWNMLTDARLWVMARIRYSSAGNELFARWLESYIRPLLDSPRKVLALDLDNTLWGGVVGEVGAAGIALSDDGEGFAYKNFQRRLKILQRLGVLLVINSKNNPHDVEEVWEKNPHMLLKREDFAFVCANWENKASNLRKIAEALNLGLDSFVFIDDNPAERELIRRQLPMIATPDFPESPERLTQLVSDLALRHFNKLQLTSEDGNRTAQYQARFAAESLKSSVANLDEYYAALEMTSTITQLSDDNLARAEQLTQKTNQFNLTTKRYTAGELKGFCSAGGRIYLMSLADRFDHHGIVAMAMVKPARDAEYEIDNLLMSCRVIGRTVERTLLAHIATEARRAGGKILHAGFIPTSKNQQVADLYPRMGFAPTAANRWALDLAEEYESSPWIVVANCAASDAHP